MKFKNIILKYNEVIKSKSEIFIQSKAGVKNLNRLFNYVTNKTWKKKITFGGVDDCDVVCVVGDDVGDDDDGIKVVVVVVVEDVVFSLFSSSLPGNAKTNVKATANITTATPTPTPILYFFIILC